MNRPTNGSGWRVGVDTGGTFTDLLLIDENGDVRASCKLPSTPDDPGRAVRQGIDRLLERFAQQAGHRPEPTQIVHGSTVATNALLEDNSDRAVLITTAGFEDLLTLARQDRPELYALAPRRQAPPIDRGWIIGAQERVGYDGKILQALAPHEVNRIIQEAQALQPESVALCLLHSYANAAHERTIAQAIREKMPDVHLTVSSELLPELREYERASTCAVNAVIGPTMSRYIGRLSEALGPKRLRIMASGGGTLPPARVIDQPVQTVMSGPAGGVVGAWAMAQTANQSRIIGFDMGGTSTDVSLCDHGLSRTTHTVINAMPIRLPVIDIHTVGAGGGSIAWIDAGGALRVGPQSAGADPGPACYGKQGDNPSIATVTDAHAVLGHLRDGRGLGDTLAVDKAAAHQAVGTIAQRLGLSAVATAEGILRVADAAMARAIQRISVQRGHDARDYTLLAFGGAGGLHACRLAELLGMTRVLVPVYGGLLSAYGMLAAPPRYAYSHAVLRTYPHQGERYPDPLDDPAVRDAIDGLHRLGDTALEEDGIDAASRVFNASLDLRYAGQSYEINVPVDPDTPVIEGFIDAHRRLYGYAPEARPIELVAVRVEALGPTPQVSPGETDSTEQAEPHAMRVFNQDAASDWLRIERGAMKPGPTRQGPAVIEEYAATTVVPPGWLFACLPDGQIRLEYGGKRDG